MPADMEWTSDGPNIMSSEQQEALRLTLEESFVIVEHRFLGGPGPQVTVFSDFDDLQQYLRQNARPGDSIWCWRYDQLCRDDNSLTHGKYPDDQGRTPRGGAY